MCCCDDRAKWCRCCECWHNIMKKFDCPCCVRYFPEWRVGASWYLFLLRSIIIIILTALMCILYDLIWSKTVFETSEITFGSFFMVTVFYLNTTFLMLLYGPYLIRTYPWWVILIIVIVYIAFSLFLGIENLIRGNLQQFETDSTLFDIWALVHFLAGPFFALVLPFIWMFIIVTVWELMEVVTVGFGEAEIVGNRIVDILAAVLGWWMLILVFKHTRKNIPWISTMNSAGNNGEEIDWKRVYNKYICCDSCREKEEEKDPAEQKQEKNTVVV